MGKYFLFGALFISCLHDLSYRFPYFFCFLHAKYSMFSIRVSTAISYRRVAGWLGVTVSCVRKIADLCVASDRSLCLNDVFVARRVILLIKTKVSNYGGAS